MIKSSTIFRVESDFLGEKLIPKDAYYGIQTMRAVENFPITGYKLDVQLIKAMAIVKKSAAQANCKIGQLDKKIAKAIVTAADEIIAGHFHDQFIVDPIQGGAGTSINMNTNEVIANRSLELLGEEKGNYKIISPNTHVNMSQSTNDTFPTAIHLATLQGLKNLLEVLELLHQEFLAKSDEFQGILKMGRTHLQDAVPIRLGQEFSAYACVLERYINRISRSRQSLYIVNMGATAVGTGLNADPEYIKQVLLNLAEYSGYPITGNSNLIDGTQNTDVYSEVSSALKNCMVNLSKVANDLRLMASGPRCGFNEINLPPRQPGSSIMPGKVNPVMAEVVNQSTFQVIGNDLTITMACEAGQFELNVMEPVIAFNLLESIKVMTNVLNVFRKYCIQGITPNLSTMRNYVDNSVGIVTALNPIFGYETVASIAKQAIKSGSAVKEIVLKNKLLTEEEWKKIIDPFQMTNPGINGKGIEKNNE